MEQQGYAQLVNMNGGLLGATDMSVNIVEPGWIACGFETAKKSVPGRSWRELAKP